MLLNQTNLENYTKNILKIPYVNFEGIDPKTIKMVLKVLKEAFNRYPLLKKALMLVGKYEYLNNYLNLTIYSNPEIWENYDVEDLIMIPEKSSLATMHLQYGKEHLFLGLGLLPLLEKYNLEQIKMISRYDRASINHREIVDNIVWHEVGHMLDFIMGISNSDEFQKLIQNRNIKKEISRYATTNNQETLAEAFAEYILELKFKELQPGLIQNIGSLVDETYLKYAHNFFLRKNFEIIRKRI